MGMVLMCSFGWVVEQCLPGGLPLPHPRAGQMVQNKLETTGKGVATYVVTEQESLVWAELQRSRPSGSRNLGEEVNIGRSRWHACGVSLMLV